MRRPLWFFDLDNTLHDASSDIFPYINDAMTSFVARRLHLDRDAASQVRNQYWQQYGATLLGAALVLLLSVWVALGVGRRTVHA